MQENKRAALAQRESIIDALVSRADQRNQGWYRAYFEERYEAVLDAVYTQAPLTHGFRGLELQEELRSRRLL